MHYGPCGGVRDDLSCELGDRPCPFAVAPLPPWTGGEPAPTPPPRPDGLLDRAATRPVVLTDLSVTPYAPASVRRVVGVLAASSDALLVGEHQSTPDLPPTLFAAEVLAAGGRPWTTLTCRDRNRVVLEQEIMGLAAVGVEGVLCATGDVRAPGVRPDVTQVFDLDGTRLAALAAAAGLVATVPEAPEAAPRDASARAGRGQAARRGPALRAEPRRQPGGGRAVRRRRPRGRGDAAVRGRRRRLHRRALGPRPAGLPRPAPRRRRGRRRARCTRTRRPRGSPRPSTRRGPCSRSRESWASTCPGWRRGGARWPGRRSRPRSRRRSGGRRADHAGGSAEAADRERPMPPRSPG